MVSSINAKPQNSSYGGYGGGGETFAKPAKGSRSYDTIGEHPDANGENAFLVIPPPKEWPEVHLFTARIKAAALLRQLLPFPRQLKALISSIDDALRRFEQEKRRNKTFVLAMKRLRNRLEKKLSRVLDHLGPKQ
ncbi:MAG: hypothetical protein JSR80_01405 [Verrucomicrobia bacterium]|nr:hypothetical protein [Verrucomicrobiota bacterium]